MQCHGIHETGIQGESLSGNVSAANKFKNYLEFINNENVTRDQIYNADEIFERFCNFRCNL